MGPLNICILKDTFAVCRLDSGDAIPPWVDKSCFWAIAKTDDEFSVVCSQANLPEDIKSEKDWRAFKILGPLDFALIGILNKVANALAKRDISIFGYLDV